jgi:hypothetical protein
MIKKYNRFLIVVLFLGWVLDFLFWDIPVGVNFSLFAAICLLGGFFVLIDNDLRPAQKSLWLLIPIAFFVVVTVIRQEMLTVFLAYLFALLSAGLLINTYLGGRWIQYSLLDYLRNFFLLIGSIFSAPLKLLKQYKIAQVELGKDKKIPYGAVARGILIALPMVVIFSLLLSSADVVFEQKIANLFDEITGKEFFENLWRFVLILLNAYWLMGVFLHAAWKSEDKKLVGEDKPIVNRALGFTETAIVFGSVMMLFTIFVVIQFQYLFGGEVNIGVEGYTYSEYARRGFYELIWVAFISLVMILGFNTITQRETRAQKQIYSGLASGIVLLVLIILVSAFKRLMLGIDWHGYSRLRLYPSILLIWLGLLLIAVVVLEILRKDKYSTFAALLASFGFAASLVFFNVDTSIVHHNVLRPGQGKHFNVTHLTSLSLDAVPALAEEFENTDLSDATREGIGVALMCYKYSSVLEKYDSAKWQSFNYSSWKAIESIEQVEDYLEDYRINVKKEPMMVRTPSREFFECDE